MKSTLQKLLFEEYKDNNKALLVKLRYNKDLVADIEEETSFLNQYQDTSISERIWYIKNDLHEPQLCPYCNERKRRFKKLDKGLFPTCGHEECQKAGMSKGAKAERDWDKIQAKMKATYKARTGYDHNMRNPEAVKKFVEKFTVEHNGAKCGCLTENGRRGYRERFDGELIRRSKEKMMIDVVEIKDSLLHLKCINCGEDLGWIDRSKFNRYTRLEWNLCNKCYPGEGHKRSIFEDQVEIEIKKIYKGAVETNKKIFGKDYEFDIVIPDRKLLIECNGLYYHSDACKDKEYHRAKKTFAERHGYKCFMIWEDDWYNISKRKTILSFLSSFLCPETQIRVKNSEISISKSISREDIEQFMNENSIYSLVPYTTSYSIVADNNEIIACALVGPTRFKGFFLNQKEVEIYRMSVKNGYDRNPLVSLLVKNIQDDYKDAKIIFYNDSIFDNILLDGEYEGIMTRDLICPLTYQWLVQGKRRNKDFYAKDFLVKLGFDPSRTQEDIVRNELRGYKIFGPGMIRYIVKNN